MRGQILYYDDGLGSGLISGDDGARYEFRRADMQQLRPLRQGMRVDFVAEGHTATKVYVIDNPGPQAGPTSTSAYSANLGDLETSNEDLGLWGYFTKAMGKSFNGEGRARRKEYWSFVLFQIIFYMAAFFAFALIAGVDAYDYDGGSYDYGSNPASAIFGLFIIILVVIFIPAGITVTIRRLHDIGLTGWFIFLSLIPYLGGLILLIMSLIPSERRANKHGPYPKPLD